MIDRKRTEAGRGTAEWLFSRQQVLRSSDDKSVASDRNAS
jgi:hypothetical protein